MYCQCTSDFGDAVFSLLHVIICMSWNDDMRSVPVRQNALYGRTPGRLTYSNDRMDLIFYVFLCLGASFMCLVLASTRGDVHWLQASFHKFIDRQYMMHDEQRVSGQLHRQSRPNLKCSFSVLSVYLDFAYQTWDRRWCQDWALHSYRRFYKDSLGVFSCTSSSEFGLYWTMCPRVAISQSPATLNSQNNPGFDTS